MITATNLSEDPNYRRYLFIQEVDEQTITRAKEIFRYYVAKGVITDCYFQSNIWNMNNEMERTTCRFNFSDAKYLEKAQRWTGCDAATFRLCAKTYCSLKLGSLAMMTIHLISLAITHVAESTQDEIKINLNITGYVAEMLEMLPGTYLEREGVIELLQKQARLYARREKGQRILTDFRSYFRFGEEINRSWEGMETKRKLAFFPVYLWWNLTVIIPLRVTEFLMMPRDCLGWDEGNPTVIIRRTRLKGKGRGVTYKIESDYEKETYPITAGLAEAVKWYLQETDAMIPSPIDALFRRQPHMQYFSISDGKYPLAKTPYSYLDLDKTLTAYYSEELEGKGIERIGLGDTRHIAMMNLIISGGSPTMCMELAGHEDINISSHYYSNMSNLVECATYELYRKKEKTDTVNIFHSGEYSLEPISNFVRIDGGWCRSPLVKRKEAGDCIKALGDNGEIGFCRNCRFFRPDAQGVTSEFFSVEKGKRQVDKDCWFLMYTIEAFRRGIGCQEEIGKALMRLRRSCAHYQGCILWRVRKGE